MNPVQTAALIISTAGALPLLICFIKMYLLKKFKAKAAITTALVTASEKRRGLKNSTYYLLQIKYSAIGTGVQYSAQTIEWKKYAAGDTIPLMYLLDKPEKFKTDFGKSLKFLLPFSIIFFSLILWFCHWLLNTGYYEVKPLQ
jgi:hypothetical protein